jgi:hypothetical protein
MIDDCRLLIDDWSCNLGILFMNGLSPNLVDIGGKPGTVSKTSLSAIINHQSPIINHQS